MIDLELLGSCARRIVLVQSFGIAVGVDGPYEMILESCLEFDMSFRSVPYWSFKARIAAVILPKYCCSIPDYHHHSLLRFTSMHQDSAYFAVFGFATIRYTIAIGKPDIDTSACPEHCIVKTATTTRIHVAAIQDFEHLDLLITSSLT